MGIYKKKDKNKEFQVGKTYTYNPEKKLTSQKVTSKSNDKMKIVHKLKAK